jgi:hypothetical protein
MDRDLFKNDFLRINMFYSRGTVRAFEINQLKLFLFQIPFDFFKRKNGEFLAENTLRLAHL